MSGTLLQIPGHVTPLKLPVVVYLVPVHPLIGSVIDKIIAARIVEEAVQQLVIRKVARLISDHMRSEQFPIRSK